MIFRFASDEPKEYTRHGNLAGPGYERMTEWISDSWHEFRPETIINSFISCGITNLDSTAFNSQLKKVLIEMNLEREEVETESEVDDLVDSKSVLGVWVISVSLEKISY